MERMEAILEEEERLESAWVQAQALLVVLNHEEKVILTPLINLLLEKLGLGDTQ